MEIEYQPCNNCVHNTLLNTHKYYGDYTHDVIIILQTEFKIVKS